MSNKLPENILIFARGLRRAGLKLGALEVMNALKSFEYVSVASREEFYWILHTNFVKKQEDRLIFSTAFALYFKKRGLLEKMMETLLPQTIAPPTDKKEAGAARIHEAFNPNKKLQDKEQEIEQDARSTFSNEEILAKKDFAQMTALELQQAFQALKNIKFPCSERKSRRFKVAHHGDKIDLRQTLKASQNSMMNMIALVYKKRQTKPRPLVILIDISGSMSAYSRLMLHFCHALMQQQKQVYAFTFGTRLTPITRYLRDKDIDIAMQNTSRAVPDWGGGTRLASTLHEFNRHHSRRVLANSANILLVTDGLERDNIDELEVNIARLSRMCNRLIWLNPLLRFDGFEPKAKGVRAILPHVDDFRSCHNLNSIAELVKNLSGA